MSINISRRMLVAAAAFGAAWAGSAQALTFTEVGGRVIGQAEDYTRRTDGASRSWEVFPDERSVGDSDTTIANPMGGRYLQLSPDLNVGGGGPTLAPSVEYDITITTTGTYRLYLRADGDTPNGNSDSLFADIVQLKGAAHPDWYEMDLVLNQNFDTWDGNGQAEVNTADPAENPMTFDIAAPGTYTLRLSQREDGAAVDAFVLQLNSLAAPTGEGFADPAKPNLSNAYLYYSFEDSVAGTVLDDSGNGRDGTLSTTGTGAVAYQLDAPAVLADYQSLRLTENGNNNGGRLTRVIEASDLDFDSEDWSFATWFKRADQDSVDMILHIGSGDGFGTDNELQLMADANGATLRLRHDPGEDVNLATSLSDPLGWNHVAVTYDADTDTFRFYLNGAFIGSDTGSALNFNQNAANPVVFGGHNNPTFQASRWLNGSLDDLALWNEVIDARTIGLLARGVSPLVASTVVPEPAAAGLLSLGAASLLLGRRRRN